MKHFDIRLGVYLIIVFIIITPTGTILHELGHYTVAKYFNHETSINYKRTSTSKKQLIDYFMETQNKYADELKNDIDFPGKQEYIDAKKKYGKENMFILLGGPLQTMLTGTIGYIILFRFRKRFINRERVNIGGWIFVFIALFWLRQIFNLLSVILIYMKDGELPTAGDEVRLALYFNINPLSIQLTTGLIGVLILISILRLLPKRIVGTFLISGFIGALLGYYLWFVQIGKYILP
ncbi:MAG: hypothetical protein RL660_2336 [Bacteroidota bacterium]